MLSNYDKTVSELNKNVIDLGIKIEKAVELAWKALETRDIALAAKVYNGDDEIDQLVKECMRKDLNVSMLQSPAASDWRSLMATLKILSDLERIADHCADICHYVMNLEKTHHNVPLPEGLKEMYGVMASMVSDVLDFYEGKDSLQADLMKDKDDIVDMAFVHLMDEIAKAITENPQNANDYISFVLVVKYIERMADHANNIAEWIIYREKNEINI